MTSSSSSQSSSKSSGSNSDKPAIIKKYANRRLYDLSSSRYVTLDDLSKMIRDGQDFTVVDAKTEEDITRSILTQIIVEEEAKGENLLPIEFLKNIISFYGNNIQTLLPKYLELSMKTFLQHQENFKNTFQGQSFNPFFPPKVIEETVKTNLSLFENAFGFFTPSNVAPKEEAPQNKQETTQTHRSLEERLQDIESLQKQVNELQNQIIDLKNK